jgi:hypothetical protein
LLLDYWKIKGVAVTKLEQDEYFLDALEPKPILVAARANIQIEFLASADASISVIKIEDVKGLVTNSTR